MQNKKFIGLSGNSKNICKFPGCSIIGTKKSCLRRGLCNKHRKWAEKKIIDWDTCEILDSSRVPKGKEWTHCKLKGCIRKHKSLGFCSVHYSSFKINKTIDKDGNNIGKKFNYDYQSKCKVINCFKKHKLSKGFCKHHYTQHKRGIINFDGFLLRKLKKISKYPAGSKCKTKKCKNPPRTNWFCAKCASKFNYGSIDINGNFTQKNTFINIGKICSDKSCKNPAKIKGLCTLHYTRKRIGYLGKEGYKNVGQKCTSNKCFKPAYCRSLCGAHYRQYLRSEKGLKTYSRININKKCRVRCCENKAYSKLLCESHYSFYKRISRLDIVSDIKIKPEASLKNNITLDYRKCSALGCKSKPMLHNLCANHLAYFRENNPEILDIFIKNLARFKKVGSII